MEATIEAKLGTYSVTKTLCQAYLEIMNGIPALQEAYGAFVTQHRSLMDDVDLVSPGTSGTQKALAKEQLARVLSGMGHLAATLAIKKGDPELRARVDFSFSYLDRMKDELLPVTARALIGAVTGERDELVSRYGFDARRLDEARSLLGAYEDLKPKPRLNKTEAAVVNARIKTKVKALDRILSEEMDRLVASLEDRFPEFVQKYKGARVIVDPARRRKKNAA